MDLLIKVVTQFFGNGTIVLGLVALIGSILLKKKGSEILLSTIKACFSRCVRLMLHVPKILPEK